MNKILVICAHPDDESLGLGGTLCSHVKKGDKINGKPLIDYVVKANEVVYHYDINKFTPCQFAQYNVGDFYDFHQDSGHQIVEYEKETRKLSIAVNLSDADSYEGGEFYFYNGGKVEDEIEPEVQKQGSILVFDSRMWHRVAPVTKGVRYSLVSWILGPHFR